MSAAATAAGPLRRDKNNYPAWALHQLEPGGSLGMEGAGWWLISLVPCENSHPSLPYSPAAAFSPRQQQSPRYLASPPPEHHLGALCLCTPRPWHGPWQRGRYREVSLTLVFGRWGARFASCTGTLLTMGVPPPLVFGSPGGISPIVAFC